MLKVFGFHSAIVPRISKIKKFVCENTQEKPWITSSYLDSFPRMNPQLSNGPMTTLKFAGCWHL